MATLIVTSCHICGWLDEWAG